MSREVTCLCLRCHNLFRASSRRRRNCDDCKAAQYARKLANHRRERPTPRPAVPRHTAPRRPIQLSREFVLALPEMRAELARQCAHDGSILIERGDPTRLTTARTGH